MLCREIYVQDIVWREQVCLLVLLNKICLIREQQKTKRKVNAFISYRCQERGRNCQKLSVCVYMGVWVCECIIKLGDIKQQDIPASPEWGSE